MPDQKITKININVSQAIPALEQMFSMLRHSANNMYDGLIEHSIPTLPNYRTGPKTSIWDAEFKAFLQAMKVILTNQIMAMDDFSVKRTLSRSDKKQLTSLLKQCHDDLACFGRLEAELDMRKDPSYLLFKEENLFSDGSVLELQDILQRLLINDQLLLSLQDTKRNFLRH